MSVSLLLLEFVKTQHVVVKGDCSISGYKDHISLKSFSWGLKAVTKTDGGRSKTKVKLNNLTLTKHFDQASVPMFNMMNSDTKFIKAILRFIDPTTGSKQGTGGASKFDSIMEIELMDGYIESISVKVSDDDKAISISEEVVLSFNHVILGYSVFDPAKGVRIKVSPFEFQYQ